MSVYAYAANPIVASNVEPVITMEPCPSTPNCVSSWGNNDPAHSVDPIIVPNEIKDPMEAIETAIATISSEMVFGGKTIYGADRVSIEQKTRHTFDVTVRTFLGFPDSWRIAVIDGQIRARFSFNIGQYDVGVNRANYLNFKEKIEDIFRKA